MRHLTNLMSELRWALLILGLLFIVVLAFWERRRPRQASPHAGERGTARDSGELPRPLREPTLTLPEMRAREPLVPAELPVVEMPDEPGVPRLQAVTEAGEPELLADPVRPAAEEPRAVPTVSAAPQGPVLAREALPELPAAPPPVVEWPPDASRRIVALRLVAMSPERFAGRSLRQALAAEGFVLGQFAIFHKPDEERRAVLSAASLTRPGTFDMDTMDSQHYGGLSLFAVLPGPKAPPQTFDELVFTARNLNDRLHGVLQDEQGSPLTPARIAILRERLGAEAAS
jgi:cell division protein ZipA